MPDKKPITNKSSERKISIIENTPAVFEISDDLNVVDTAPIYEIDSKSEVVRWCGLIIHVSERHNVDPRLAMAIMYMETTHVGGNGGSSTTANKEPNILMRNIHPLP